MSLQSNGSGRIILLDTLRGFALLGILLINIQGFSMISAAYVNPAAYGDLSGTNYVTWFLTYLFADSKFLALFSMLFGAGLVLLAEKHHTVTAYDSWIYQLRRLFILFIIGLIHAYLVWPGDILASYAVCGVLILGTIKWPARYLLTAAILLLSIPSIQMYKLHNDMQNWEATEWQQALHEWQPAHGEYQSELLAYRGKWTVQQSHRFAEAVNMQTRSFPAWLSWRIVGMMLIGMALYKLGFITGKKSRRLYLQIAFVATITGLTLIAWSNYFMTLSAWSLDYFVSWGYQVNYWASLLVVAGYISIVVFLCKFTNAKWITIPLANIGKTALSNYLLQSLVCTFIFYGHGLALFGHVQRTEQLIIVLAVWSLQLVLSTLWLRYFQYGPVEWLWRSASLLEWQKIRNHASPLLIS